MVNLFIVDDHAMMREGLKRMMGSDSRIKVIGEADNGRHMLEKLKKLKCDLLIMDINLPDISGLELIDEVKKSWPKLPILILSMHNTAKVAKTAFQAGANGYLAKDSYPEKLTDIVRKVARGEKFIDPAIANKIFFESNRKGRQLPHERLTDRELGVLLAIVKGQTINSIAKDLFLSPKTISTHKKRLMEKMGLDNVPQLVRYANEHYLA